MKSGKLFLDSPAPVGSYLAFFEDDGDSGYLYLMDRNRSDGDKIIAAAMAYAGRTDLRPDDVEVRWAIDSTAVCVIGRGQILAAIDATVCKAFPANYVKGTGPCI